MIAASVYLHLVYEIHNQETEGITFIRASLPVSQYRFQFVGDYS